MKSFFSLENSVLGSLKADVATRVFRNLLWCEAQRTGLSLHNVVVTLRNTVSDGGIDARAQGSPRFDSILLSGANHFQIKTGQAFKPWQKSSLKKELFGNARTTPSHNALDSGVQECFKKSGQYILVTFGHDLTDPEHRAAKSLLTELLKGCGYKKPRVDVLGQSQILGLIARYPSLVLDVQGKADLPFLTFEAWQTRDDMRQEVQLAEPQTKFLTDIRDAVRGTRYQHVRIIGEPGIGKTRLVLEALSADDLKGLTVYVPHPEDFQRSVLFNELIRNDLDYRAIIVIDECVDKERASIWNSLKGKPGIKLLTIDHGPERSADSEMLIAECPRLPEDQIRTIIASYLPKGTDVRHWASWCDGIPRVAHAVGENLKRNPEDLLKPPATVPMWERFIAGYEALESRTARDSLTILRHLALFTRFGFEEPVTPEAQYIASLIEKVDPSITWARFQEVVEHLRGRRILQGKRTLFIVPKMLHIYLWVDYWNTYGRGFDFTSFLRNIPSQLHHWFLQLFIYAHASPVAQHVVAKILSPMDGPFSSKEFLMSEDGAKFVSYLAEADAANTLKLLEATVGQWLHEELLQWEDSRQSIVWALEKIAIWREHFAGAARVLIKLALAENAQYSNNSSGILFDLFLIGVGWAPTQATPEERFQIIKECLGDKARRSLGLNMCKHWFTTHGAVRTVGAEHQGLRPEIEFWRPKLYSEIWDAYRLLWRHLLNISRTWDKGDRRLANDTLIESAPQILRLGPVADEVMETMFLLADDDATDLRHLTHFVIHQQRFPERKPKGIAGKLNELDKKITGNTFETRFARHVLNTTWDEDYRERKGDLQESKLPTRRVEQLVDGAVANPQLLLGLLPQLVRTDGHRLNQFGLKLAERLRTAELIKAIVEEQLRALPDLAVQFTSSYFGSLRKHDRELWESSVLSLLEKEDSRKIAVRIIQFSESTNVVIRKALDLYKNGQLGPDTFDRVAWNVDAGNDDRQLMEDVLAALVHDGSKRALTVAVDLAIHYFFDKEKERSCSEEVLWRLIKAPHFYANDSHTMAQHYWESVTRRFRKRFPHRDIELLRAILSQLSTSHSDSCEVADEIAKDHPAEAWAVVSKLLGAKDGKDFWIRTWLGGRTNFGADPDTGAIIYFHAETIISWALRGSPRQVSALLHCLPKTLDEDQGGRVTRLFIETFGDDPKIASALISHFWNGGWSGPMSAYLSRKRESARSWLTQVPSGKTTAWLHQYIDRLGKMIVDAEIEEEREF
ncbi:MAG: hypothetical protein ACJ8NR_00820 [Sulfurifustis sp.]